MKLKWILISPREIIIYTLDGKYFCQINALGSALSDEEISRADILCTGLATVEPEEL